MDLFIPFIPPLLSNLLLTLFIVLGHTQRSTTSVPQKRQRF